MIDGRQILLVRHVGENDDHKLGFAKGHVDPGEEIDETARREVLEETRRRGFIRRYLGAVVRESVEYDEDKNPVGPSIKTVHMFLMEHTVEIDQNYEGHTRPEWCDIDRVLGGDPEMQMRHPEEAAFLRETVLPLVDAMDNAGMMTQ
jgi:8-oxo-dGTP pyrophosphatase MutT (NUDIX family)